MGWTPAITTANTNSEPQRARRPQRGLFGISDARCSWCSLWLPRAVTLIALLVLTAVVVLPASIPQPVQTDAGMMSGVEGAHSDVRVYKGIPFAAPPVGDLRWKAPRPAAKWEGVKKAGRFGNVCVQPKGNGRLNVSVDLPDSPKASEDCLYLNVWTAAASATDRRPVMVWIFGGAYSEGAGSSPHNDGEALARKGVVTVTFNYRLGPFGFFSHPELTRESGHNASGNYALMDALAALRWVHTNIAAFGGDPRNVTIFGESAGSSMSAGLVGSPEAKGLFQHAISESGAWMGLSMAPMRSRTQAEQPTARRGGPAPPLAPLAELRARSTDDVARTMGGAGMIVDGWIIPEDLSITFNQRRQNDVDVLIGSNKDEGSFIAQGPTAAQWESRVRARWGDLADAYLKLYPASSDAEAAASSQLQFRDEMAWHMRLYADLQTRRGRRGYWYFFTHEPATAPDQRNLKSTHTAEIPYVFNNLSPPRVFPDTSSPELTSASPADRALAETVSSYWVNFARTGDPNGSGLPDWPVFKDKNSSRPMVLGAIKEMPDPAKLDIYDQLYAKQMAGK
jgi:para-nitrobenzyl esterase